MKVKFAWLRLAALVGIACASPAAFAADPNELFFLSWTSPIENDDGSPLTDLQGYYVYIGQSPDALQAVYFTSRRYLLLRNTSLSRYFALSAVNTSGVESALTEVLSAPPLDAPQ